MAATDPQPDLIELEAFIVEEVATEASNSLLPTDRTIDTVFFEHMSPLDTPRSVLAISPEAMRQFRISDFDDLEKIGAGTERYNFYGIAGAPVIRGWQGGTYFNGMMRAYQRNEMPTSFGSLEALDILKGPAPAHLVPSHIGGYANMIPKSPFYDRFRGSLEVEIGSWDHVNIQADIGGPTMLGSKPAAYRVSLTAQQSGSYYDRINHDYVSLYGAVKTRWNEHLRIFTGGEFFQFRSNENAGWNRPTQGLIDDGEYVVGEPLSVVRAVNGGFADRNLIDGTVYDYGPIPEANRALFRALVVPAELVENALANGSLPTARRDLLLNMADAETRERVYRGLPADVARTTSGYLYTPDYFHAGGKVFTEQVRGSTVVSDNADFADSQDFIYFFDLIGEPSRTFRWKHQLFLEHMETDKLSSYGYAFQSEQFVFDNRLTFTNDLDFRFGHLKIGYGPQIRYSEASQLQDFWVEPFPRRDITTPEPSANTRMLAGGQRDPTIGGGNYWAGGFGATSPGGHAAESELLQLGAFVFGDLTIAERFSLLFGLRGEHVRYDLGIPAEAADARLDPARNLNGDLEFLNFNVNPIFRVTDTVSLYGAFQEGTTIAPMQAGVILGESNFGDGRLREGGAKVSLLDGRLFVTLAAYAWEQASFDDRAAISNQYESEGVELELVYKPFEALTFVASFSDRETRKRSNLSMRALPFGAADPTGRNDSEVGIALEGGALFHQFSAAAATAYGSAGAAIAEGNSPAGNPEHRVPGAPESTVKLFAIYEHTSGFGAALNTIWRDAYWHDFDHTLRIDSSVLVHANLFYRHERFEVMLSVENLTNEDYFIGSEPEFGANTLITKGEERRYELTFRRFF